MIPPSEDRPPDSHVLDQYEKSRGGVGVSIPRVDAIDKVTGKALYAADIRLPHTVPGKIIGSPTDLARGRRGS